MRTFDDLVKRCKASVTLEANDYRDIYEKLEDAISEINRKGDEISKEELEKILASGNLYRLQFYPNTPIGFYVTYGSSAEVCIEAAHQILDAESCMSFCDPEMRTPWCQEECI